jgi:hypothetical protein
MAASPAHDAKHEDWVDARAPEANWTRVQWFVWTLFGLALLGAFLLFVANDYPLRNLIAVQ